jgi:hypothetical protein
MPTVSALDILRSAKLLVDRHGADAVVHAGMRVDELAAAGDEAGARTWLSILDAVKELQRTEPLPGEVRH